MVAGLVLALLAAAACAAPTAGPAPPAAAATQTRRAADATAGRVASGDLVQTPTPSATPAPRPTCPGALWWYEARRHVGEERTVQGPVVRVRALAATDPPRLLLELGQPYPDPTGVAVLLPPGGPAPAAAQAAYAGRSVCATGPIRQLAGLTALEPSAPGALAVLP